MRNLFLFFLIAAFSSCDFKSAKTYFAEATKLEQENRLSEAIKTLGKAIEKDENYLPAYINRGADKSILGDYKGAIQDYSTVLKKDPKNTLAFLNRGKNKHRLQDYKGAIADFDEAIKTKGGGIFYLDLKPNDFVESGYDCSMEEIKLERGVSLYFTGDLKQSYSDMQFCIGRKYERKIALYWRGMILISTNKKDLGCRDLQEAAELGNADAGQEVRRYCK